MTSISQQKKDSISKSESSFITEDADAFDPVNTEGEKSGSELEEYITDIASSVKMSLDQSIGLLTPWFFKNMPKIYYQATPRSEKVRHLTAVITGHIFESKQTIELWNEDKSKVTYIGPGSEPSILVNVASKLLPLDIKLGTVYFSYDKLLFLSTFFAKNLVPLDLNNERITTKVESARKKLLESFSDRKEAIEHYITHLDNDFVTYGTVERIVITFRMLHHMLSHEGAHTYLETAEENPSSARLTIGIKGLGISDVFENILRLAGRYGFDIGRAFVCQFEKGYSEPISVMHFALKQVSKEPIKQDSLPVIKLIKAVRTLAWVDSDDYNALAMEPHLLSVNGVNFCRSLASWIHILLGKENSHYYSEYKILRTFISHSSITQDLVELFRVKFDPLHAKERDQNGYAIKRATLAEKIDQIIDVVAKRILLECLNFTDNVLKTNYFLPTKTGLAFRISSQILDPNFYPQKPFGIFFMIGRDYRCFHVRWKDISRGGLRVVMPRSVSDHGFALSGLFDEVYGLSLAQQLKNKDIPEGGSKAVLVLRPQADKNRAVRGAINALLDLLVAEDESHEERSKQISYYSKEEIIYLGPDENVTNDLIEWIPTQAKRRGYQFASAFMSSKPGAGINHKEYGVTSEGLQVFVDGMIRYIGIDPKNDRFTIKITGGPDGDVAGNALKILHREYGEKARVVAIADGFGAAYDPEGLDWSELLRLVKQEKSIAFFEKKFLSKKSEAFVIHADTSENIKIRNELYALAPADIFIPAGGRPYTVTADNYKKFVLESTGKPSCRAIVEGANIYFTVEARTKLHELGILIIKDSSANKTGVICSSFEIIASLILSDDEFKSIKPEYVQQVIRILRKKASQEANLLFAEYARCGRAKSLVSLSMEISKEINEVTDLLLDIFSSDPEKILKDEISKDILLKHCPKILADKFYDRIFLLPQQHKIAILAAYIASYIVYKEGLGWLDSIAPQNRHKVAVNYMKHDLLTGALIDSVDHSQVANKDKIIQILKRSAARDLTMFDLES